MRIRDDINQLTKMVNRIRLINKTLVGRNEFFKDFPKATAVIDLGKNLIGKLEGLEASCTIPKPDHLRHPGTKRRRQTLFEVRPSSCLGRGQ